MNKYSFLPIFGLFHICRSPIQIWILGSHFNTDPCDTGSGSATLLKNVILRIIRGRNREALEQAGKEWEKKDRKAENIFFTRVEKRGGGKLVMGNILRRDLSPDH